MRIDCTMKSTSLYSVVSISKVDTGWYSRNVSTFSYTGWGQLAFSVMYQSRNLQP